MEQSSHKLNQTPDAEYLIAVSMEKKERKGKEKTRLTPYV